VDDHRAGCLEVARQVGGQLVELTIGLELVVAHGAQIGVHLAGVVRLDQHACHGGTSVVVVAALPLGHQPRFWMRPAPIGHELPRGGWSEVVALVAILLQLALDGLLLAVVARRADLVHRAVGALIEVARAVQVRRVLAAPVALATARAFLGAALALLLGAGVAEVCVLGAEGVGFHEHPMRGQVLVAVVAELPWLDGAGMFTASGHSGHSTTSGCWSIAFLVDQGTIVAIPPRTRTGSRCTGSARHRDRSPRRAPRTRRHTARRRCACPSPPGRGRGRRSWPGAGARPGAPAQGECSPHGRRTGSLT